MPRNKPKETVLLNLRRPENGKGYRMRMDRTHVGILNEIMNDPDVSSREIAKSLSIPLSTIQRRRSILEESLLLKNYVLDLKELGWRTADLFIGVDKGNSEKVAKTLLAKPHVLNVSTRVGHPEISVAASVFYKSTEELHSLVEETKAIPNVKTVEWSEVVSVINKKQTEMLALIFGSNGDGRGSA
jgi:DNA-binding Lrp family transcriptional regulator